MVDLYVVLKVKPSATLDQIKRSFRKIAARLHPDRNPGNKVAEEEFKRVSAAFAVLSDPAKRKEYDQARLRPSVPVFSGRGSRSGQGVESPEVNAVAEMFKRAVRSDFVEELLRAASKVSKRACPLCRGRHALTIRLGPIVLGVPCPMCGVL